MQQLFTEKPLIGYSNDQKTPLLFGNYLNAFINTQTPFAPLRSIFAYSQFNKTDSGFEARISFNVNQQRLNEYITSNQKGYPIFKPFIHNATSIKFYRVLIRLFDSTLQHDVILTINEKTSSFICINEKKFLLSSFLKPLCTSSKRIFKYVLHPFDVTDYLHHGINQIVIAIDNLNLQNVSCFATETIPLDRQTLISLVMQNIKTLTQPVKIDDSDSEEEPEIIDARCSISYHQLIIPVKGKNCTHPQLFDLYWYLDLVQNGQYFNCPVCDKACLLCDLLFDEDLKSILDRINDKSVTKISLRNGTFTVVDRISDQDIDYDEKKYTKQKQTLGNTTRLRIQQTHSSDSRLNRFPTPSSLHENRTKPTIKQSPKPQKQRNENRKVSPRIQAPKRYSENQNDSLNTQKQRPVNEILHTQDHNGFISYTYSDGSISFIKGYIAPPPPNQPKQFPTEPFQFQTTSQQTIQPITQQKTTLQPFDSVQVVPSKQINSVPVSPLSLSVNANQKQLPLVDFPIIPQKNETNRMVMANHETLGQQPRTAKDEMDKSLKESNLQQPNTTPSVTSPLNIINNTNVINEHERSSYGLGLMETISEKISTDHSDYSSQKLLKNYQEMSENGKIFTDPSIKRMSLDTFDYIISEGDAIL
ncbi:hypothetical protein QTN25_001177 [Entamoeba marina]